MNEGLIIGAQNSRAKQEFLRGYRDYLQTGYTHEVSGIIFLKRNIDAK